MTILVTGGAGFIGSHTCVELLNAGYDIVIVDNLYNSSEKSLDRVRELTGKDFAFYPFDIRDKENMQKIFDDHKIDACIHFAGLKAVGESCSLPLRYYHNNLTGTFNLLDCMLKHGLSATEWSWDEACTAFCDRVEGVDRAYTCLHDL